MALTINLPQSIEQQFRQEAASKGVSLDNYLLRLLKHAATLTQPQSVAKPLSETELLKKINLDISEVEWANYRYLVGQRRAECLTEQEHEALIALGDKIEVANAKRLKYLIELAQLRGISLEKLTDDLAIKPMIL
jgi:hypothetical protein